MNGTLSIKKTITYWPEVQTLYVVKTTSIQFDDSEGEKVRKNKNLLEISGSEKTLEGLARYIRKWITGLEVNDGLLSERSGYSYSFPQERSGQTPFMANNEGKFCWKCPERIEGLSDSEVETFWREYVSQCETDMERAKKRNS